MSGCVDPRTLEAYARGQLPEALASAVEAHLETCRRCAKRCVASPEDEALVERIRDLERSRADCETALTGLRCVQDRVTTTLFGPGMPRRGNGNNVT